MIVSPVILPIPQRAPTRSPQQVRTQRKTAREALMECAKRCGAPLDGWEQNADGSPRINRGFHWSITHKRLWAAAVVATRPVGVDLEHMLPRRRDLSGQLAGDEEWALLGDRSRYAFYRLWTAKEATLKALGKGIADLLRCRLIEVPDDRHLMLELGGETHSVEHFEHADHIAAVTCGMDRIEWIVKT